MLFAVISLAFALLALARLPEIWRGSGSAKIGSSMRGGWPFGEALRKGWVRALPVGIVGFLALSLSVATISLFESGYLAPGTPWRPLALLVFPLIGIFVISVVFAITVVLFNRPRFVVSPAHRGQPGAIAEWRGRR